MTFRNLMRMAVVPLALFTALAIVGTAAAKGGAGGVSGPAFFVDGTVYRTVGTPTDLSGTGAPAHSFDTIYDFGGLQMSVATAAPGDDDYNGGRWRVHGLMFSNYAGALADGDVDMNGNDVLDSDEEVAAAIDDGYAIDVGVVKSFVCPVIKMPAGQN